MILDNLKFEFVPDLNIRYPDLISAALRQRRCPAPEDASMSGLEEVSLDDVQQLGGKVFHLALSSLIWLI